MIVSLLFSSCPTLTWISRKNCWSLSKGTKATQHLHFPPPDRGWRMWSKASEAEGDCRILYSNPNLQTRKDVASFLQKPRFPFILMPTQASFSTVAPDSLYAPWHCFPAWWERNIWSIYTAVFASFYSYTVYTQEFSRRNTARFIRLAQVTGFLPEGCLMIQKEVRLESQPVFSPLEPESKHSAISYSILRLQGSTLSSLHAPN